MSQLIIIGCMIDSPKFEVRRANLQAFNCWIGLSIFWSPSLLFDCCKLGDEWVLQTPIGPRVEIYIRLYNYAKVLSMLERYYALLDTWEGLLSIIQGLGVIEELSIRQFCSPQGAPFLMMQKGPYLIAKHCCANSRYGCACSRL